MRAYRQEENLLINTKCADARRLEILFTFYKNKKEKLLIIIFIIIVAFAAVSIGSVLFEDEGESEKLN